MADEIKIQTVVSVSPDLPKKEVAQTLNNLVAESEAVLAPLMGGGKLIVFALSRKDRYHIFDRAATNLSLLRKIYNDREILENPELGKEFAEIGDMLKKINAIIEKRKEAYKKRRKAAAQQKKRIQAATGENGEGEKND